LVTDNDENSEGSIETVLRLLGGGGSFLGFHLGIVLLHFCRADKEVVRVKN
jgi:hypothetical protein